MDNAEDLTGIVTNISQANIIQILGILVGAWLLITFARRFIPWVAERLPTRYRVYLLAMVPVVRLLVITGAFIMIVPRIIEPTFQNLVALLGALGLALGFAFKDYASSLIAGVIVLFERPYRPGDWVEIEGAYGLVRAVGARAVEIVTPDDTMVVIPHLKMWNLPIFNGNNGTNNLMVVADYYLHPDHDARVARQLLHDVALTSPYLKIDQPINVIIAEKPWGTHYRLKAYPVDPAEQFNFLTDLTVQGKKALTGAGMSFAVAAAVAGGEG